MAALRGSFKLIRPWLIMLLMVLVLFINYITATEKVQETVSDNSNDFAEFEQEGDDEEEETPTESETPHVPPTTAPTPAEQVQEEEKDEDDATVEVDISFLRQKSTGEMVKLFKIETHPSMVYNK